MAQAPEWVKIEILKLAVGVYTNKAPLGTDVKLPLAGKTIVGIANELERFVKS